MAIQARPEPAPLEGAPTPTVHELLVSVQRGHISLGDALTKLLRAQELAAMPADLRGPFRLGNTASPSGGTLYTVTDDVGISYPSIGFLNSSPVNVYVGVGGIAPRAGQGAIVSPANSLMVLPISAGDVDLGVDPTDPGLSAGNVVVHVLRFHTVQPAFLAVLGS